MGKSKIEEKIREELGKLLFKKNCTQFSYDFRLQCTLVISNPDNWDNLINWKEIFRFCDTIKITASQFKHLCVLCACYIHYRQLIQTPMHVAGISHKLLPVTSNKYVWCVYVTQLILPRVLIFDCWNKIDSFHLLLWFLTLVMFMVANNTETIM